MRMVYVGVFALIVLAANPVQAKIRIREAALHSGTVVIAGRTGPHQVVTLNRRLHKRADRRGRFVFYLDHAPRGCTVRVRGGRAPAPRRHEGCRTHRAAKARHAAGVRHFAVRPAHPTNRSALKPHAPERTERPSKQPGSSRPRIAWRNRSGWAGRPAEAGVPEVSAVKRDRQARKGRRVLEVSAVKPDRQAHKDCKDFAVSPGRKAKRAPRCRKYAV